MTTAQHARVCTLHAGVWQILADWLSGERPPEQSASSDALDCLDRASQLWARVERQLAVETGGWRRSLRLSP
jgi:hypothetical protein